MARFSSRSVTLTSLCATRYPLPTYMFSQIKAFGLNRMDLIQREGGYPITPGMTEILGVEFSGTIAEVGVGCKPLWKLGDEVVGLAVGVRKREWFARTRVC